VAEETSYVIVAIPSKDDYVWKISSEKIPHLTLLYLDANINDIGRVEGYIQHVIDTTLTKFMLEVEDRGVLGAQSADVVFFDKNYCVKKLSEFRRHLLTNNELFKAYESVEQYPEWVPHLTLGYPETPAKPDTRDYPGVQWVNFDRIALWTGDYEGVEFPLKRRDDLESNMYMTALGEKFFQHYGVKGMKWGVLRDKIQGNAAVKLASSSDDHKQASAVKTKAKLVGVNTLSNKELETLIRRMDLEVKFKDLKTIEHNQSLLGKGKKWAGKVVTDVLVGAAISWLRRPGGFGGKRAPTKADAWVRRQPGGIVEGTATQRSIGK
jgi:2'-5' RNA ligase